MTTRPLWRRWLDRLYRRRFQNDGNTIVFKDYPQGVRFASTTRRVHRPKERT